MRALLVAILSIFLLAGVSQGAEYTYDGPIDPIELTVLECKVVGQEAGAYVFFCDKDGMVVINWVYKGTIVQYAYKVNGVMHVFRINHKGHYAQIYPEKKLRI